MKQQKQWETPIADRHFFPIRHGMPLTYRTGLLPSIMGHRSGGTGLDDAQRARAPVPEGVVGM